MNPSNNPLVANGFLYVGGGLGDVARRFYHSTTYEVLNSLLVPTPVICYSHNPGALEFFRFHPNCQNLVLFDVGHVYMHLLRLGMRAGELDLAVFSACGFSEADKIATRRDPQPIRHFHAPDLISPIGNYIVVHPFARGWGDWPKPICETVADAVRSFSNAFKVYVIGSDYITADAFVKRERSFFDSREVIIVKNTSAPSVFTLVAGAKGFIGTMSSLAQVAAFERIPSLILHPKACKAFDDLNNGYGKTIRERQGINLAYDAVNGMELRSTILAHLVTISTAVSEGSREVSEHGD